MAHDRQHNAPASASNATAIARSPSRTAEAAARAVSTVVTRRIATMKARTTPSLAPFARSAGGIVLTASSLAPPMATSSGKASATMTTAKNLLSDGSISVRVTSVT